MENDRECILAVLRARRNAGGDANILRVCQLLEDRLRATRRTCLPDADSRMLIANEGDGPDRAN